MTQWLTLAILLSSQTYFKRRFKGLNTRALFISGGVLQRQTTESEGA
jgi:hypothetical protein